MTAINPFRAANTSEKKASFPVRKFASRFEQNEVIICGIIENDALVYDPRFGKEVLSIVLLVTRRSGVNDRIPVGIPFELASMCNLSLTAGAHLMVCGQIRTFFDDDGMPKTEVFATLASHISSSAIASNTVRITGKISKPPAYYVTPFGREVTSVVMHVPYSDAEYRGAASIPVIFWGSTARMLQNYKAHEVVSVCGRFQSRDYEKLLPDGTSEKRTTFEVSAYHFTPIERDLINNRGIF